MHDRLDLAKSSVHCCPLLLLELDIDIHFPDLETQGENVERTSANSLVLSVGDAGFIGLSAVVDSAISTVIARSLADSLEKHMFGHRSASPGLTDPYLRCLESLVLCLPSTPYPPCGFGEFVVLPHAVSQIFQMVPYSAVLCLPSACYLVLGLGSFVILAHAASQVFQLVP